MNTTQIKKFATAARQVLKQGVANKLTLLGFNGKGEVAEADMPKLVENGTIFQGNILPGELFYNKWMTLYHRVQLKGVQEVYEEAAYTWFNRLMAIRILEKNNLTAPILTFDNDHARIPQLVQNARRGQFPQLTESQRTELTRLLADDNRTTEQFQVLITAFCQTHPIISACFGGITDYTEILLPNNILAANGFLDLLNHTDFISDDDYTQSELIGWLYQFYISEKKDDVFASFKAGHKAQAEDIPAATQIFTPNWIVRYMVDNTLGRIYLDNNPDSDLAKGMTYLVKEQTADTASSPLFRYQSLHQLTCADLSCGSGHILNEFFNLLYKIYLAEGYMPQQAIEEIFRYNIVGVDLDTRAKQLSTFALLLKACQRDEAFCDAHCLPRVLDMPEPWNDKQQLGQALSDYFRGEETPAKRQELLKAFELLEQADNLGSIMKFDLSDSTLYLIRQTTDYWLAQPSRPESVNQLLPSFQLILALTQKYAAICMNPPYMGSGNMNNTLSKYVKDNYAEGKEDLATVFVLLFKRLTEVNGSYAFIIPPSWMFLSTFESLRKSIIEEQSIESLLHLSRGVFGADFGSVAAVIKNAKPQDAHGTYFRLVERTFQEFDQKHLRMLFEQTLADHDFKYRFKDYSKDAETLPSSADGNKIFYPNIPQNNFEKIPGRPIGYWVSDKIIETFTRNRALSAVCKPTQGLATADNARFLRLWFEVNQDRIGFGFDNAASAARSQKKWFPYNKGGSVRKWYGLNELVINWYGDGAELKNFPGAVIRNPSYYFKEGITFPRIGSNLFYARYSKAGSIFDCNGPSCFPSKGLNYTLAFLNSSLMMNLLEVLCPTLSFQIGDSFKVPFKMKYSDDIDNIVSQNISLSKSDWDAHETSWDFQRNELLAVDTETYMDNIYYVAEKFYRETGEHICIDPAAPQLESLEWRMEQYKLKWERNFMQLHENEEELNRQFIGIYGLEDELTPDVPLSEITILQQGEISIDDNELKWHDDVIIKQLISYAVGCMMGRYRLDKPGLHIAHPNPTADELSAYTYQCHTIDIDDDAIIPLLPADAPFPDNANKRLEKFIADVFGEDTLQQNLNYINQCLGEPIETYLVKHFWDDHLKMYQKRPIYWLFSSKKGAFRCITYMHRMNKFTVDRIRTKYLLPYIEFLQNNIAALDNASADLTANERRRLERYRKDLDECREYHDRLHNVANQMIEFDLDDGVIKNYALFGDVLTKLK